MSEICHIIFSPTLPLPLSSFPVSLFLSSLPYPGGEVEEIEMEVEEATDTIEEKDPREEVRVRRPHIHSSLHDTRHGFTPGPTTASLMTVLLYLLPIAWMLLRMFWWLW